MKIEKEIKGEIFCSSILLLMELWNGGVNVCTG